MKGLIFFLYLSVFIIGCSGKSGSFGPEDAGNDLLDTVDTLDINDVTDVTDDIEDVENPAVCGNGFVEGDEACDDGNNISGDGCNSSCRISDGMDRVVNTVYYGDQTSPAIVEKLSRDGTFVVLYTDWGNSDGSNAGIRMRIFSSDGTPHDDVRVNTTFTSGNQYSPAGAMAENGNIFVVWTDEFENSEFFPGIRGKIVDINGDPVTDEFTVDTNSVGEDLDPSIAVNSDGVWMVSWVDTSGDGGADLKARLFDSSGNPMVNGITADNGEFLLPVPSSGIQKHPYVSVVFDSMWGVIYEDYSGTWDSSGSGVSVVIMSSDGSHVSSAGMNSISTGNQSTPSMSSTNSTITGCWIDDSHLYDPWGWGVHCRVVDGSLTGITDDFQISDNTLSSQLNPTLFADPTGFTVFWEDWGAVDGNGAGIRGRRFNYSGVAETDEIPVNSTYLDHQISPAVILLDDLYFVVWEDSSSLIPDEAGRSIRIRTLRQSQFTGGE